MSRSNKTATQAGTPSPPQNRDVNASNRVSLALQLRSRKMSYDAIAKQCGYADRSSCRKAILRELDRTISDDVEQLRREEMDSLDRLELECWKRLSDKAYEKSLLFAVDRIVAIKDRRAKLMGLDLKHDDNVQATQIVIQEVPRGYLEGPKIEVVEGVQE